MPTTASALIDSVRLHADWTGATDAQVLDLLNRFQLRLQREHDFTFQECVATRTLTTSASGFSRFAEPTDSKQEKTLYYIESSERKEITYLTFYDAVESYPDPSKNGKPEHWSSWRDEVYVFPSLQSAVTVEMYYYRFLPDFTATESNDFLVWGHDALFYGTMREYYNYIGEEEKAKYWQVLLSDAVTSLLRYHTAQKNRSQPDLIMRTPGQLVRDDRRSRWGRNARW